MLSTYGTATCCRMLFRVPIWSRLQVTQKAFYDGAPQWAGETWTTPMRSAVTRTLDARLAEAGSADALCRAAHASEVPHTEVRSEPVLSLGIEIPDSASSEPGSVA
jgi:hypothetical protein